MPTFNGETLIVTLDSGVTTLEWIDVYSAWKDWMLESPLNRRYPKAFRPDGGNPLSTIINQGSYFFLNNLGGWRVKPPEEDITIYATGNLAVEDTTLPALVPTDGAYTAAILGLQPITQGITPVMGEQLAFSSFGGGITVDVISGHAGIGTAPSGGPIGTLKDPSNNLTDALTIASDLGFGTFYIIGDVTIDNTNDFDGFIFVGESEIKSVLTVDTDASVIGCEFYDCTVAGILDGDCKAKNCVIGTLNYVSGTIQQCILESGTITLGGSNEAHFLDCWSGVAETSTPVIDMGGSGQELSLRNYYGGIKLINKSGNDNVSIDLSSGNVILASTVTAGTIVVRGIGKLVDESGEHIHSGTWNGVTIVNELVNSYLEDMHKTVKNKKSLVKNGSTWELIIYEDDNITPLFNKVLKDKDGNDITDLTAGVLAEELQSSV